MSCLPKVSDVQRCIVKFLAERFDKVRMRNAFADARRAQAARLLAQQVGAPLDHRRDSMTLPRQGRNAAIGL